MTLQGTGGRNRQQSGFGWRGQGQSRMWGPALTSQPMSDGRAGWPQDGARGAGRFGPAPAVEESGPTSLARGLGWASVGLGLAYLVAPGRTARAIGVGDDTRTRTLVRLVGLRELGAAVGLLASRRPVGWARLRVAGDAMDLALVGRALRSGTTTQTGYQAIPGLGRFMRRAQATRPERTRVALATLVGLTAVDVGCALWPSAARRAAGGNARGRRATRGVSVRQAITIRRSPTELYQYWRDFTNLPRMMRHLEAVRVLDDRRSRWQAKAPAGTAVEWEAEIIEDRPDALIVWRSLPDASVPNAGSVRFIPAPGDRGTEIHVELRYDPPGGKLAALVAKLFGEEPAQQVRDDLRHFKQMMETGEIARSDANLLGAGLKQHPAQPPETLPRELAYR